MAIKIKIKQNGGKEFLIEENKIWIIENNIIYIEANGEQTVEIAALHLELDKLLQKQIQGKLNYLINLNRAGKSSPAARKVWQKISESETTLKVALFGVHPVARILATFVMGVTNKKDIRFFNTKNEAILWLKS
ncbi:MAG: STAS/SEC14 domain-containing protein [Bacteroidales bacterium]|nr:STAS/SEC14 domain-containing protein [Bacteroidales bacterium]